MTPPITRGPRVIILGATSAMAEAAARIWAGEGASFVLAARNADHLRTVADDLRVRGASMVEPVPLDLAASDAATEFSRMVALLRGIDIVLLAYGVLGEQDSAERDPAEARQLLDVNFTSAAAWSLAAADQIARQGSGTLIVIGSVAGDRGRLSNYVYGAAKAGLAALTEGIAHRLAQTGGRAVLIKPGFVDTPMTAHISNKGALWAKPEMLGDIIVKAARGGGPVVYAPWFWRYIMMVIRLMPWFVFRRLKI